MTKSYKETNDNIICKICLNEYKYLGSHIWHKHGITTRKYKSIYGLDYNLPLMNDQTMQKKRDAWQKHKNKYLKNLNKKNCFKKGHNYRNRFSEQSINRYKNQLKIINNKEKQNCPVCNMKYQNVDSHLREKHQLKRIKTNV